MSGIADRIRTEADQASRAGQYDRLQALADEVEAVEELLKRIEEFVERINSKPVDQESSC